MAESGRDLLRGFIGTTGVAVIETIALMALLLILSPLALIDYLKS